MILLNIAITQLVGQYCNKKSDKMQCEVESIPQVEALIIQLIINTNLTSP